MGSWLDEVLQRGRGSSVGAGLGKTLPVALTRLGTCCHVALAARWQGTPLVWHGVHSDTFVGLTQRTRRAMTLVGIPEEEQDAVFQVVASVLHLGNIKFREGADGESSDLADNKAQAHLVAAAKLLGCDAQALFHALTTRTRHTHDGAAGEGWKDSVRSPQELGVWGGENPVSED